MDILPKKICDKTVESHLVALNFVLDWFVTSKIIENLGNPVFFNDHIFLGKLASDIVTFFSNDIGVSSINLNNINHDDDNFDDCHPEAINHVSLLQDR